MAKKAVQYDWRIKKLGGARAKDIGIVSATTPEAAITKAIEDYGLKPSDRNRLIAEPA